MAKDVEAAVTYLHSHFPALDETLLQYLHTILVGNVDLFDSADDVNEAIGEVLEGVDPSKSKSAIDLMCREVYQLIGCKAIQSKTKKLLDAPVRLNDLAKTMEKDCKVNGSTDFPALGEMFSANRAAKESSARQDKLEYEMKKKQGKLQEKEKQASNKASLATGPTVDTSTVSQQVNRRDVNMDKAGGRTADVRLENFDLSFGSKTLLRNANLNLAAGRRYGLVGRNGLGKTTLLRAISRRQVHIPSHLSMWHVEQEVVGDHVLAVQSVLLADVRRTRLAEQLKRVQSELSSSSGDAATLALQRYNQLYAEWIEIEGDRAESKAAVILHGLGFAVEMQTWPTRQFSGGWRMRLALAQALFCRPDLLLLDEPTNMLDLKAIVWLENYLTTQWPGMLLVVSHDRNFLNHVCQEVVHLIDQRLDAYPGDYESFTKSRKERLVQQQTAYEAQMQERQHIQVFIDTFRYNANRAALVQSKIKLLERMPKIEPVKKEAKVVLRFTPVEKLSPPILLLDEVTFHYHDAKPIFKRLDFNATMESKIGMVGENGAGKTTLLKLLLGELKPVSGERHSNSGLRMGYYHQHHVDQLDLNSTPLQIMQARYPNRVAQDYYDQLGSFGVSGELAGKPTITLSGGQKARVQFAVMCFPKPNFLILDEPTNHLDMETISALGKALIQFQGGLILVSHDERLLEVVCTEIWLVTGGGRIVERLENGMKEYRTRIEKELQSEQGGASHGRSG